MFRMRGVRLASGFSRISGFSLKRVFANTMPRSFGTSALCLARECLVAPGLQ